MVIMVLYVYIGYHKYLHAKSYKNYVLFDFMEPFIFVDNNNISNEFCDTILNLGETIIPLYPEESNDWYSITNLLVLNLTNAIESFIQKYSLDIYNISNILQNTSFLQSNMEINQTSNDIYHSDFGVTDKLHSTISYLWCLSENANIIFNGFYTINIKKGDLVLFPATWEYQYKFLSPCIYIKGILYNSYE